MPAPCQSGKTAPLRGLGSPYNLHQISPKEVGKTAPQRGMHTPYGLRQLVQGHVVPTTSSSTTGTGTATKSVQGLSIPFACVGSSDPVRVLCLYTTNTLDVLLKHLLLRHMYNLPLLILMCYAQALRSETSYCYCDHVTLSVYVCVCVALYCAVLYILLV